MCPPGIMLILTYKKIKKKPKPKKHEHFKKVECLRKNLFAEEEKHLWLKVKDTLLHPCPLPLQGHRTPMVSLVEVMLLPTVRQLQLSTLDLSLPQWQHLVTKVTTARVFPKRTCFKGCIGGMVNSRQLAASWVLAAVWTLLCASGPPGIFLFCYAQLQPSSSHQYLSHSYPSLVPWELYAPTLHYNSNLQPCTVRQIRIIMEL